MQDLPGPEPPQGCALFLCCCHFGANAALDFHSTSFGEFYSQQPIAACVNHFQNTSVHTTSLDLGWAASVAVTSFGLCSQTLWV